MRVFCPVMEIMALPMNHARQNHFLRCSIAAKLIGNDHAWLTLGGTQQLSKEQDRCDTIPSAGREYR
jgi:hypothetical protein